MRVRILVTSLSVAASLACGDNGNAAKVTVTQIAPGAQCPAGGVSIASGSSAPQIVCNGVNGQNGTNGDAGANGVTTLIAQTALPFGDPNCPKGGTRIDSGADANGNGALDTAEITATAYVCNGLGGPNVRPVDPPGGAAGTAQVLASGGAADGGTGGNGAQIQIGYNQYGTYGGHVEVFKTGAADATFDFPAVPNPDLGDSPIVVAADTAVPDSADMDAGLPEGALYLYGGSLFVSGPAHAANNSPSGVSVAPGVTLSFDQPAAISASGSCVNQGTIHAPALTISCTDYYGDTGSSLTTTGATAGGSVSVYADSIWNHGAIDASGAAGASGGNGGAILLSTNNRQGLFASIYNTGAISSTGGAASTGVAGFGGTVDLSGGNVFNSGPIDVSGGAGQMAYVPPSMPGGALAVAQASHINLQAGNSGGYAGALRNSGTLKANGGDIAATCTGNCSGNPGGGITLQATTALVSSGAVSTHGGASPASFGGVGGGITVTLHGGAAPNNGAAPGDLLLSGTLDSSGGAGVNGGNGNNVQINYDMDYPGAVAGQQIVLYGYAALDASGGPATGDDTSQGGSAGTIQLFEAPSILGGSDGNYSAPAGSIVVYSDVACHGGAAPGGGGGGGGFVQLTTQSQIWEAADDYENVIVAGNIDLSGGTGVQGGNAGALSIFGNTGVTNHGALTVHGGQGTNGRGGSGAISEGPGISIASPNGDVTSDGVIDGSGGASAGSGPACTAQIALACGSGGGDGGRIQITGRHVSDSANILAAGGSADTAGGYGGSVAISSSAAPTSITAAAPAGITVAGGSGSPAGPPGTVEIDGRLETADWTH